MEIGSNLMQIHFARQCTALVSYRSPDCWAGCVSCTHTGLDAPPTCNCRNKAECPLPGRCTIERVCYQADVKRLDNGEVETYTGVTKDSFKKRYGGHKSSFSSRKYEHSTSLSTHIWKLKDQNIPYEISWEIVGRAAAFNPATNTCRLCLLEKYLIMFRPAGGPLNQSSEFFTTCRHKQSKLVGKVKFKK